mmetsp:Transcript_78741/g.231020  ORF Transcript_78741/g.231020 Transcript_78741/m.231020 type:complete len:215 (+) Transcript_78741:1125-1769(+)
MAFRGLRTSSSLVASHGCCRLGSSCRDHLHVAAPPLLPVLLGVRRHLRSCGLQRARPVVQARRGAPGLAGQGSCDRVAGRSAGAEAVLEHRAHLLPVASPGLGGQRYARRPWHTGCSRRELGPTGVHAARIHWRGRRAEAHMVRLEGPGQRPHRQRAACWPVGAACPAARGPARAQRFGSAAFRAAGGSSCPSGLGPDVLRGSVLCPRGRCRAG